MALKDLMGRTPAPEPARPAATIEPAPVAAPIAPPRAAPPPVAHLGASCKLTGELRSTESLRIDGQVKGEIHCDQTLTIGESGAVFAAIEGDTVVIAGEVRGDITARHKIMLERTARVTGDLSTPGIIIQEGAQLEGRIVIGGSQSERAEAPKTASRAAAAPPPIP